MNECTKPLLWDANYDPENNDSTNAQLYVRVVLNSVIFPQFFMILFHMLDAFYLAVKFFPKNYFNKLYASSYRKI